MSHFSSNYVKRTSSEVLPAQLRRRFTAMGTERGRAGRGCGTRISSPPLPSRSATSGSSAHGGARRDSPAPRAIPGARRSAPPRLRRLHNGAGRGEPSRTAGSGLRNRCSPDPVSKRAEEPRPLPGAPLQGFPDTRPRTQPGEPAASGSASLARSQTPGYSRWDERRRRGRQRAPAGEKLSPPARSWGLALGRGSPYLG